MYLNRRRIGSGGVRSFLGDIGRIDVVLLHGDQDLWTTLDSHFCIFFFVLWLPVKEGRKKERNGRKWKILVLFFVYFFSIFVLVSVHFRGFTIAIYQLLLLPCGRVGGKLDCWRAGFEFRAGSSVAFFGPSPHSLSMAHLFYRPISDHGPIRI